jgi:hypothetical protein
MYGSPDLTCLLCKVYKCDKKDLQEKVFRTQEYGFVQTAGIENETQR